MATVAATPFRTPSGCFPYPFWQGVAAEEASVNKREMAVAQVTVELLGPIRALVDGHQIEISSAPQRLLLTALALRPGTTVSVDRLIEYVWGEHLPKDPRAALQVAVSKLRSAVGSEAITTGEDGYKLAGNVATDLADVEAVVRRSAPSVADLERALNRWRGDALAGVSESAPLGPDRVRIDHLRTELRRRLLDRRVHEGSASDVLPELAAEIAADPLDEQLAIVYMEALLAMDNATGAARHASRFRKMLWDECGLEPGHRFQDLEDVTLGGVTSPVLDRSIKLPAPHELVGRADALASLDRLVEESHLTTVVGPGGVGKTSLVAVWSENRPAVRAVELHHLSTSDDVMASIADQLGIRGRSSDAHQAVLDRLAATDTTLIIDNCEHLLHDVRCLVEEVRRWAPRVQVICTSRRPLGLHGEQVIRLGALRVPDPEARPSEIREADAVRLFAQRVQHADPSIRLTDEEIRTAARICVDLDGLPLAIELAAARVPVFAIDQLHDRLVSDISILDHGEGRHRSLTSVLEWSMGLLNAESRTLLANSAIFEQDFELDDLQTVAGAPHSSAAFASLVEASLVVRVANSRPVRYRLQVPTRAHVLQMLPRPDGLNRRFVEWGKALAAGLAEPESLSTQGLERLVAHVANLRGVLRAAHALGDRAATFGIGTNLGKIAYFAGNAELYSLVQAAADVSDSEPAGAGALAASARAASMQGAWDLATHRAEAALQAAPDNPDTHMALHALAIVAYYAGDYGRARDLYRRIADNGAVADPWRILAALEQGAAIARGFDRAEGQAVTASALEQSESRGFDPLTAWGTYVLGSTHLPDEPEVALALFKRAMSSATGDRIVGQLAGVGRIAALILNGEDDRARAETPNLINRLALEGNQTHVLALARLVGVLALRMGLCDTAALIAAIVDTSEAAPRSSSTVEASMELDAVRSQFDASALEAFDRRARALDFPAVLTVLRDALTAGAERDR